MGVRALLTGGTALAAAAIAGGGLLVTAAVRRTTGSTRSRPWRGWCTGTSTRRSRRRRRARLSSKVAPGAGQEQSPSAGVPSLAAR